MVLGRESYESDFSPSSGENAVPAVVCISLPKLSGHIVTLLDFGGFLQGSLALLPTVMINPDML